MNQIKTEGHYKEAKGQLNSRQKEAVETIEGPVLVIAGPGTGKTQILAARIAYILEQTDTLPENILCLTYTDAGTISMRKRLTQFIGPDAYRIPIFTFHAFCHKVIQENLDYFGLKGLDAVTELERRGYVRKIIDGFPKNHPLKRYSGDVYYEADKLLSLYAVMKREDWSVDWMLNKVDEHLKAIETSDEFIYKKDSKYGKKGEHKKTYYEEVKRFEQLKSGVNTFADYTEILAKHSRYDFEDMILWVIRAFRSNPAMLSSYQEQFFYFLVDEYQDTSGSQNHLLQLLIDYWTNPNVFCVGDDDQSIFRFQGANVQNIHEFVNLYKPVKISLTDNYRSSQLILDASRVCIAQNKTRIDDQKELLAKNGAVAESVSKPQIRAYRNPMHEACDIADEIIALLGNGVEGSEIAVLYRTHQQAEKMITYLQSHKVALNNRRKVNVLNEPLIKKLIHILRYVSAENKKAHTGEVFLYELLHFDFWGIEPIRIAQISVDVYRKNFKERTTSWRDELLKNGRVKTDLFHPDMSNEPLVKAGKLLEHWISESFNMTLQQLTEKIITQSGMLVQALTSHSKSWNMQLLHTFFSFIKSECLRNPKTSLQSLLSTLDLMEEERVQLPVQQIMYAENGVNFISTHSAKGLEFEYVFLIGCNSNKWEKARTGSRDFKLPDTIFDLPNPDETEENRRLFYVALTRAKRYLTVSYAMQDDAGKELEKSRFVAELETAEAIEKSERTLEDEQLIHFGKDLMEQVEVTTKANLFDNELVDDLLKDYTLSVTHLNNYLKCPTAFYFNNLIRVPSPLSPSMTFGSAVHHALEQLFKKMNVHPDKEFASPEELVDDFKWYMRRNEDAFTPIEYKRRIEYGEDILPRFYKNYIHEWNKVTSVERSYRNVVMDGVPLNGKLDKLEFEGKLVNVVDYKTGNYQNALKKFNAPDLEKSNNEKEKGKAPSFETEYGGDYWRQAVFYKILMDYDKTRDWEMRSAEFDFVEPDKDSGEFRKQRVNIIPEYISTVQRQIKESYNGIKQKKFENGCHKDDCIWCNFVDAYYQKGKTALSEIPEDIED